MKDVKEKLRLNIKLSANETKRYVVNDFFNKLRERFMNLCRNVTLTYLFRELCALCETNNDRDSLIFTIMKDGEDVTASEELIPYGANLTIKFKSCNSLKKFKYFRKNRKVEELIPKEQVISKKKSKEEVVPKKEENKIEETKKETKEEVIPKKESKEKVTKKETVITKPREKKSKEKLIPKPSKNTNCCCGGCNKCCRNRSLQKT